MEVRYHVSFSVWCLLYSVLGNDPSISAIIYLPRSGDVYVTISSRVMTHLLS